MIPFKKFEAFGNDFVLIDARSKKISLNKSTIKKIGSRTLGVGFDQLLFLNKSKSAQAKLIIYNQDGSRAEMCGNGLRAVALYLFIKNKNLKSLKIETDVGVRSANLIRWLSLDSAQIECEMGVPILKAVNSGIQKKIRGKIGFDINVGNPHLVSFYFPKNRSEFLSLGADLESHKMYPKKTNVQFVKKLKTDLYQVLVYERGVGETQACGSGAVAVARAVNELLGFSQAGIQIQFPGGVARVKIKNKIYWLEGKASFVFRGKI